MKKLTTVVALCFVLEIAAAGQVNTAVTAPAAPVAHASPVFVRDATFQSAALGRTMKYRIILPAGYETSARRYPVLYLLHGLTGDYTDWENRTHVARYVEPLQLVVVMPDGGDSWYTDSVTAPADKFETYIAKDLVNEIERKYRVLATRHGRAIAGLSMGGYGAMKIALKHPDEFSFAGSFSGALGAPDGLDVLHASEQLKAHLQAIYGPPGSPTRAENDPMALLKKAEAAQLPYLYFDCGASDFLLKSNREFLELLNQKQVAYEYHEVPGAHTWQYWDQQLQVMLAALARHMELR